MVVENDHIGRDLAGGDPVRPKDVAWHGLVVMKARGGICWCSDVQGAGSCAWAPFAERLGYR